MGDPHRGSAVALDSGSDPQLLERRSPAQRGQPIDVVILIRSGIDENDLIAARPAQHPQPGVDEGAGR